MEKVVHLCNKTAVSGGYAPEFRNEEVNPHIKKRTAGKGAAHFRFVYIL